MAESYLNHEDTADYTISCQRVFCIGSALRGRQISLGRETTFMKRNCILKRSMLTAMQSEKIR